MSVTTRHSSRSPFGTSIPVLAPQYNDGCDSWQFASDGEVLCGRSERCQVTIPLDGISDQHCSLTLRNGALTVRRIDGRIWVNELPVARESALAPGDVLCVGPVSFHIESIARPATVPPAHVAWSEQPSQPADLVGFASRPASLNPLPPSPATVSHTLTTSATQVESDALSHRSHELEVREEAVSRREKQIQELNAISLDRERALTERKRSLDERAGFLADQKHNIELQQQAAEALRSELQKQKQELEQRLAQFSHREADLSSQMESSAAAYAENELLRSSLAARAEELKAQESDLQRKLRDYEESFRRIADESAALKEQQSLLAQQTLQAESRNEELTAREIAIAERMALADSTLREASQKSLEIQSLHSDVMQQKVTVETERTLLARQLEEVRIQAEDNTRRSSELESRSEEIARRSSELESRSEEITRRSSELETRSEEIARRSSELETRSEEIARRSSELESRSEEIARRSSELASQDRDLALRSESLETQSQAVALQLQELEARTLEIEAAKNAGTEADTTVTRSVSQLAAIAAERESLVRKKQEIHAAVEEVRVARESLVAEQLQLSERDRELRERGEELHRRVAAIRQIRTIEQEKSKSLAEERLRLEQQAADLETERAGLRQKAAELSETESRLAIMEKTTQETLRKAEAERDALQNSHKDLLCERNSLMQLSQDINSRASGVSSREAILQHQTEDLRSRFAALSAHQAELQRHEAELNSRSAELQQRIAIIKEDRRALKADREALLADQQTAAEVRPQPVEKATENPSEAERLLIAESVATAEAERDSAIAERDALLTALKEMQQVMLQAQADVEEAGRIQGEISRHEQTIATLYQSIESRNAQLSILEAKLLQAQEETRTLRESIGSPHDASVSGSADSLSMAGEGVDSNLDCPESELLAQLNSLRHDVKQSQSADGAARADLERALAERDSLIEDLNRRIAELREAATIAGSDSAASEGVAAETVDLLEVDALRAQIARHEEIVQDRDDLIRELRARLIQQGDSQPVAATETPDATELLNEARELDRRASLLDDREEDLRERLRRISQSEEEVETQRRQLLDARQQLEIARAEIQVAMKQHASVTAEPVVSAAISSDHSKTSSVFGRVEDLYEAGSVLTGTSDSLTEDSHDASQDLRAELANLFGLRKPAPEPEVPSPPVLPVHVDLSEPAGDGQAVALRFGDDASAIVRSSSPEAEAEAAAETDREENSDDFVRDYMEQLLARSRKSAGNSLPSELTAASGKNQTGGTAANKSVPTKKSPQVTSFIDQYMSGGFAELDRPSANSVAGADSSEGTATSQMLSSDPIIPRVKVDRQKLRENMDSFRSVSAMSVEHALVDHAVRKEKNSINGRIFLTIVMVIMCVFLAIANQKGIINHSWLTWVSFVLAIAAGAELLRKWYAVKGRCRLATVPEGSELKQKTPSNLSASDRSENTQAQPVPGSSEPTKLSPDDVEKPTTLPAGGNHQNHPVTPDTGRAEYFEL